MEQKLCIWICYDPSGAYGFDQPLDHGQHIGQFRPLAVDCPWFLCNRHTIRVALPDFWGSNNLDATTGREFFTAVCGHIPNLGVCFHDHLCPRCNHDLHTKKSHMERSNHLYTMKGAPAMQIFHPTGLAQFLIIFGLWFIIHYATGVIGHRIPHHHLLHDSCLTRARLWELEGMIYQRRFRIRKWKKHLPEGGDIFTGGFNKKNLAHRSKDYYLRFVEETRRAEYVHWMQLCLVWIFFLFNEWPIAIIMVVYALTVNIPCIMAQRFNRPRLLRLAASNVNARPSFHP
jgi:glycosyl-4,4'-diaponeurosporenoate acyltransferase